MGGSPFGWYDSWPFGFLVVVLLVVCWEGRERFSQGEAYRPSVILCQFWWFAESRPEFGRAHGRNPGWFFCEENEGFCVEGHDFQSANLGRRTDEIQRPPYLIWFSYEFIWLYVIFKWFLYFLWRLIFRGQKIKYYRKIVRMKKICFKISPTS